MKRFQGFILAFLVALLIVPFTPVTVLAADAEICGEKTTYTVQRGDNLFRIALRFGTTMAAIAKPNGITNYAVIYAGQTLSIPCADGVTTVKPVATPLPTHTDTGAVIIDGNTKPNTTYHPNSVLPPVYIIPNTSLKPIVVHCEGLAVVSPRDGLAYGHNTFYWDGATNATGYRVNVYNEDVTPGRLVATFDASANMTSIGGDVGGSAGEGFRFSWEVQALVSDIVVCSTRRVSMYRAAPPF